jgi:hypothetical protein
VERIHGFERKIDWTESKKKGGLLQLGALERGQKFPLEIGNSSGELFSVEKFPFFEKKLPLQKISSNSYKRGIEKTKDKGPTSRGL